MQTMNQCEMKRERKTKKNKIREREEEKGGETGKGEEKEG